MEIIKYFKDYMDAINEGLIKTYPGSMIKNELEHMLLNSNIDAICNITKDALILKINQFNTIDTNKINLLFDVIFMSVVNRGGWFPSRVKCYLYNNEEEQYKFDMNRICANYKKYNKIEIIFEEKYSKEETNIPDKLYHLSIKEYRNKILKYGLIPKSKSKLTQHLDRIYICKTIEDCENLIPNMLLYFSSEKDENVYKHNKAKYTKNIEPIIYEIDNNDQKIKKLYIDINYKKGYFIVDNIHPNKISIIRK